MQRAARAKPRSRQDAGAFAAQLGLVAHYRAAIFESGKGESDYASAQALRRIVTEQSALLDQVAPKARALLDRIASGEPLADNPAFHVLLGATHARAYLQELADQAIEDAEDNLGEAPSGAQLDLLRVVAPYVELPARTMRHWLRRCREAYGEADDDERQFLRPYVDVCKKLVAAAKSTDDDEREEDDDGGDD